MENLKEIVEYVISQGNGKEMSQLRRDLDALEHRSSCPMCKQDIDRRRVISLTVLIIKEINKRKHAEGIKEREALQKSFGREPTKWRVKHAQ